MITKTVIKDYVAKRCPYLASLELEDKSLVQLLEKSIDNQEKYQELLLDQIEDGEEADSLINLVDVFKDYPHLKKQLIKYASNKPKNKAEQLVEKYNDDQIVSKLSRRYFELIYGKDKCFRCDVNLDGEEILNQGLLSKITEDALKNKEIKVIFEGQIEFLDFRARFDIMVRQDDGSFRLIEVKGSNSVFKSKDDIDKGIKDKYLYDMLFQYYVYSHAGYNISSLAYMYSSKDFSLKIHSYPLDDSEFNDFFIVKDFIALKEETMSLKKYFDGEYYVPKKVDDPSEYTIEGIIYAIKDIAKMKDVKPEMRYLCVKGPRCPFTSMCFPSSDDPDSLFKLTRWNLYGGNFRVSEKLLSSGVTKISSIPDNLNTYSPFKSDQKRRNNVVTQIEYQKGKINKKYVIDKSLIKEILEKDYLNDDIDYLLFFDFESFQYPIPLVEHVCGWKQVVSQYSMHVVKKGYDLSKHDFDKGIGGEVRHFEYIANPDVSGYMNPSIELYETLKKQLEECGIDPYASNYRVVVFNRNFEKTRMNEFVKEYIGLAKSELIEFVKNFNNNVVDLLDFFTSGGMYSKDFNGRGSLKVVQPTLASDKDVIEYYKKILPFDLSYSLDYHKGEKCLVYNGAICLDLYKSLLVRSHLGGQKEGEPSTSELLAEALAYCKIDSWGTVIIYDVIKNVYLGKLKLDALFVQ
ncbi:MAG: DUF2779 domain-containing protein [Bacilli bacterium]|nr:DUF2779 domain-containing protein [Bacilli bacterium]